MVYQTQHADLHKMTIGPDGVGDYYWPVHHKAMTAFGEAIMYRCSEILRSYPDKGEALIYKFVVNYFANDAAGLFQADLVRQKLDQDEVDFIVPEDWFVWPYILNGKSPKKSARIERLWRPKAKKKTIFQRLMNPSSTLKVIHRLRIKNFRLTIDGMTVNPVSEKIDPNAIYVTHRSNLIKNHADKINLRTIFMRSDKWFDSVTDEQFKKSLQQGSNEFETQILDAVSEIYESFAVPYSNPAKAFNTDSLKTMVALVRIHYSRLLTRDDIPKTLWTGTGGNIWDAMLRLAVRHHGGYVVGHDHGGGSAHVYMPLVGFIEMWGCDEFISFNKQQQIELTSAMDRFPLLSNKLPKIGYIASGNTPEFVQKPTFLNGDGTIKKVVFLSTLYDKDRGRTLAFYSDAAYVDWQARCMAKFISWGYEVYFKPHPDSQTSPPKAFEEVIGVTILDGLFEDMISFADMFVFDYTYTSVFKPALQTNIPMMVIDFEGLPFYDQGLELLQKRASYIKADFDDNNRVNVDWLAIKDGIDDALARSNNTEFVKRFFI